MEFSPEFTLTAEGKDITEAILRGLVSIKLTDYGGATGKTDTLSVTLVSETLKLPPKGARLQLGLGFNGNIINKGSFVVCGVESSGPPRVLTISATAAPGNSAKQTADTTAHQHRVFEKTKMGAIVETIARANGMKPRVAERLAKIDIGYEAQDGESDGAFLLRLARRYNGISKPSHGYWLFLEQGAAVTAGGHDVKAWTITPDRVTRWSYREGDRGGAKKGKKKGKIAVNYIDVGTGSVKTHEQEHDGADATHPHVHPDKETAVHAANAAVTQAKKNGRQMSISGPVRPDMVPLTAECRIATQGFGEREDLLWLTESVQFSLGKEGFSFDLSLKTDISPKGKKGKGPGVDYGIGK